MSIREEYSVNPKYKDRLFCLLFGSEECKANALSLYNALNDTEYTDEQLIEFRTIDDVIYMNMKNDVSFVIDSYLSLFEQQSTINPNMPLRGLLYFARMYEAYIDSHHINIYGRRLVKIPTPQYYVLYNGVDDAPARERLRLSDSFMQESETGDFEWTATFININHGKNESLLSRCKPLADYMTLVNSIRDNMSLGLDIKDAVDAAVTSCINKGVLADLLTKNRSEVLSVCLTEFNEAVFVESIRDEGYAEGIEKGIEKGRLEHAKETYNKCRAIGMSMDEAREIAGLTNEEMKILDLR